MKVSLEKPTSYQRVLKIEVPPEAVDTEIENIYSRIQQTATHPGFRRGKVPRKILERKFSKSIRMEAIEAAASSSFKKALEEEKLAPLTDPDFADLKFEDEGPLSFTVTIEVDPEVELGEYKDIELKRPKTEVTQEDEDKVIERLRISQAKYVPVERPVGKGDFIVIDFEAFEDGKPLKDARGENFPLEVGSGAFGEDFENKLVGMGKGEKREVAVTYPEDYRSKDLAGKEITFNVLVKDVKLRELPELDDEFAKDLGEFNTLEELRQRVHENLKKDFEKRVNDFMREQALAKVVGDSKVELPPKLKAKVSASVLEEEIKKLTYRGVDERTIAAQRDKIAEYAEAEATRQLKLTFITDAIAKRENISVSDEELEQGLNEAIKRSEESDPRIRNYFSSERVRERYREQLRLQKIFDFIVSSATIEEVDHVGPGPGAASEPDKEEGDK